MTRNGGGGPGGICENRDFSHRINGGALLCISTLYSGIFINGIYGEQHRVQRTGAHMLPHFFSWSVRDVLGLYQCGVAGIVGVKERSY